MKNHWIQAQLALFAILPFCSTSAYPWDDAFPPSQICLSSDNQTCLLLSREASQELLSQNNPYGDNVHVEIQEVVKEEIDTTLRSIRIIAKKATTGEVIPQFNFKHSVDLKLGHWFLFERTQPEGHSGSPMASDPNNSFSPVPDVRQYLSVYWGNGATLIRRNDLALDANAALTLPIHNVGEYQIHVARSASSFHLSPGSPYPRTLTPSGRSNRRAFFFFDNPKEETVTGTIYDFEGSKVRELHVDALSPANNAFVWDARDEGGQLVPSGPYFYKISAGGESLTGGLVVAR